MIFYAQVLTPILNIQRGGSEEVHLLFTIPFINRHLIFPSSNTIKNEDQPPLYINMGVHGESMECNDPNQKSCDIKVYAYKIEETSKYATDEWKVIHKIKVYNKDDGDFSLNNRHITLRFQTGTVLGNGSKIFEKLILPDIQVKLIIH